MIKSSFIGICVCLILLQSGISAFYTVSKLKHHKREIKNALRKELNSGHIHPNIVVFSRTQLVNAKWEHSKEFFLGEDKYDVIKQITSKGETKWYCIKDDKELLLLKALSNKENNKVNFEDVIKKIQIVEFISYIGFVNFNNMLEIQSSHQNSLYSFAFRADNFRPPMV